MFPDDEVGYFVIQVLNSNTPKHFRRNDDYQPGNRTASWRDRHANLTV